MFKNKINADTERRREKEVKDPILEMGGEEYVLEFMVVTLPTCQVERSPLKASADRNTATRQHKKEERAWFKNRISAGRERRREIEVAKKRPDLGEGEEECTYFVACSSLSQPAMRRDHH